MRKVDDQWKVWVLCLVDLWSAKGDRVKKVFVEEAKVPELKGRMDEKGE